MDNVIYIEDKPFYIYDEDSQHYELVDFAPDGEQFRYIVAKQHCDYSEPDHITATQFTLQFFNEERSHY